MARGGGIRPSLLWRRRGIGFDIAQAQSFLYVAGSVFDISVVTLDDCISLERQRCSDDDGGSSAGLPGVACSHIDVR